MSTISRRSLLRGLGLGGFGLLGATLAGGALSGCTDAGSRHVLTLAAGESGGSYLRFAQLLQRALRNDRDVRIRPRQTNGSAENLALLASGEADLALCLGDIAEGQSKSVAAIGRVYQNYVQCVVRADGPVTSLADLAGRRISIGAPGSGSSFTTQRLLAAALEHSPRTSENRLSEGLDLLTRGGIDACFWSGGLPTPLIDRRAKAEGLRLLDLSAGSRAVQKAHPGAYLDVQVPAGVYGSRRPIRTLGVPSLLLTRTGLAEKAVKTVVDALIDDAHSLVPDDAVGVQFLTPADLIDTGSVRLYPAAAARYRHRYE